MAEKKTKNQSAKKSTVKTAQASKKKTEAKKVEKKVKAPAKAKVKVEKKETKKVEPKVEEKKEVKKKKADDYLDAVGRRKTAVAQVRVYKKGEGKITINQRDFDKYFPTLQTQESVKAPLNIIGQADKLNVTIRVVGGGLIGQAEAVRHGIAQALIGLNPNFRKPLKKAGYLRRDARKKERKKPGLKGARRAPQWKKR
jgi:small subunit ribosomal protein S9